VGPKVGLGIVFVEERRKKKEIERKETQKKREKGRKKGKEKGF